MADPDIEELHCPLKIKKLGSNPNTSNIKRKNLIYNALGMQNIESISAKIAL